MASSDGGITERRLLARGETPSTRLAIEDVKDVEDVEIVEGVEGLEDVEWRAVR